MARTGFVVQNDLIAIEMLEEYSNEELGKILRTMLQVSNGLEKTETLTREENHIYTTWKHYDDAVDKKYQAKVENGKKGGRPKTESNQDEPAISTNNLTEPNITDHNQTEQIKLNKTKSNETKLNEMKQTNILPKTPSKRFIKPTVEEVRAYCVERKNGINADTFVSYYESKGWLVGKSPMKDWKACVRTWEQNEYGKPKTTRKPMMSDISERNNDWEDIAKKIPDPLEDII